MRPLTRPRSLPPSPTAPTPPTLGQEIQRHRRQHWLRVHYTGDFDLAAEIAAITEPLAAEISYLSHPLAMRDDVEDITDAVHEVLSVVIGMLAESKCLGGEARARTTKAVADLAQRPREPQMADAQITTGSWATALVAHVAPYSGDFATFLDRALPPRHIDLKGPSASERLETALRVLDTAALAAQRRIPRVAARQELGTITDLNAAARARRDRERAQAALTRLGVGE